MNLSDKAKNKRATKDSVGVIEDDAAVREGLCLMLETLGMEVHRYASATEYLNDSHGRSCCSCLVLDVRLPGTSGIQLQKQLMTLNRTPAIVFISGHGDIPMAVEAMRNGAVDFLQKPFKEQQLLDSVQRALNLEHRSREAQSASESAVARLSCLTPREKAILKQLQLGLRTKEVAFELGISLRTAEGHRANLMKKMHATTISELLSMCNAAQ